MLTEFQYDLTEKMAKVCTLDEIAEIFHVTLDNLKQDQRFIKIWYRVQSYEKNKAKKLIFGNNTTTSKTKLKAGLKTEGLI